MKIERRKPPSVEGDIAGFIVDEEGQSGVFGVFEDDGETGWLYLYEADRATDGQDADAILHACRVYNRTNSVAPIEADVAVIWSDDRSKCGVIVWGKMRAIIEAASRRDCRAPLHDSRSAGIADAEWLRGFQRTPEGTKR